MTFKCPKCFKRELNMPNEDDFEMVCFNCGTAFELFELGWYEEGGNTLKLYKNPFFEVKKK